VVSSVTQSPVNPKTNPGGFKNSSNKFNNSTNLKNKKTTFNPLSKEAARQNANLLSKSAEGAVVSGATDHPNKLPVNQTTSVPEAPIAKKGLLKNISSKTSQVSKNLIESLFNTIDRIIISPLTFKLKKLLGKEKRSFEEFKNTSQNIDQVASTKFDLKKFKTDAERKEFIRLQARLKDRNNGMSTEARSQLADALKTFSSDSKVSNENVSLPDCCIAIEQEKEEIFKQDVKQSQSELRKFIEAQQDITEESKSSVHTLKKETKEELKFHNSNQQYFYHRTLQNLGKPQADLMMKLISLYGNSSAKKYSNSIEDEVGIWQNVYNHLKHKPDTPYKNYEIYLSGRINDNRYSNNVDINQIVNDLELEKIGSSDIAAKVLNIDKSTLKSLRQTILKKIYPVDKNIIKDVDTLNKLILSINEVKDDETKMDQILESHLQKSSVSTTKNNVPAAVKVDSDEESTAETEISTEPTTSKPNQAQTEVKIQLSPNDSEPKANSYLQKFDNEKVADSLKTLKDSQVKLSD
jgi:hypothetical protein